jgi:hypothetical protein
MLFLQHLIKATFLRGLLFSFAVWTGLEPATHGVTGRYSNQLNYHTNINRVAKVSEILVIQN